MSTKLICSGFSGYGSLNLFGTNRLISVTSYSITTNRRIIYSQAVYPTEVTSTKTEFTIGRLKGPVIPDAYEINVSISFETTLVILQQLFKLVVQKRNKSIETSFVDKYKGFSFKGKQCYLRNFNLQCSQNGLINVSLQLFSRQQNFILKSDEQQTINREFSQDLLPFTEKQLPIAYWQFLLKQNDLIINNVLSFNCTFSQQMQIKYGLYGDASDMNYPSPCYKIYFQRPNFNLSITKLMSGNQTYSFSQSQTKSYPYMDERYITEKQLSNRVLSLFIVDNNKQNIIFCCDGLLLIQVSPELAQKNSANIFQQNYEVVGRLKNTYFKVNIK